MCTQRTMFVRFAYATNQIDVITVQHAINVF